MAQQTAVEWLDRWYRDNPEATHEEGNKALEQAKRMHKQQTVDAYKKGFSEGVVFGTVTIYKFQTSEQYYNDTYKTQVQ